MTSGPNRLLDEFAKLMTDAAGAAQGLRREVESVVRSQSERILNSMDLVQREEYEAMREMAVNARNHVDAVETRLAALEKRVAELEAGKNDPGASDKSTRAGNAD